MKHEAQSDAGLAVPEEPRYGIRTTYVCWGTVGGGADLVGSKSELETVASQWAADSLVRTDQSVTYDVVIYDGVDPADRTTCEEFLARETKVRE